jgi:hypothetical protein
LRDYDLPMPTIVSTEIALEHAAFESRSAEIALEVERTTAAFNVEQL